MDFHRNDKDGFFRASELTDMHFPLPQTFSPFDKEALTKTVKDWYRDELDAYLQKSKRSESQSKWTKRERSVKVWDPSVQEFTAITITLSRTQKNEKGRKEMRTFTGTVLPKYGRYLRMDALMFLARLSTEVHSGQSVASICLEFDLAVTTCRKWAKDLLPLLDKDYEKGIKVWEECYEGLKTLKTSDDFRAFFEKNMRKASRGMFASYE